MKCSTHLKDRRSPLIFFANGIGDGVLALPALRAIGAGFEGRAKFLLKAGSDRFLFNSLDVKNCLFVDMHQNTSSGMDFCCDVVRPFAHGCDLFISYVPWTSRSLAQIFLDKRAPISIGVNSCFDVFVVPEAGKHQFDIMFSVTQHIFPDLNLEEFAYAPATSQSVEAERRRILGRLNGRLLIGIHPEASHPAKSYPILLVEQLICDLISLSENICVCIFGQGKELAQLEDISHSVFVLDSTLEVAASAVPKLNLFIGVDSCFLHFADIHRVPGVGLFGPTSYELWGYRFAPHIHLQSARGMDEISPPDIIKAANSLLRLR